MGRNDGEIVVFHTRGIIMGSPPKSPPMGLLNR